MDFGNSVQCKTLIFYAVKQKNALFEIKVKFSKVYITVLRI